MIHPDAVGSVYRRLRSKMIFFVEGRGCTDPESVVDEALYRAFVKPGFKERDIDNIDAYAFGVVKLVLREWLRKANRMAAIDELDIRFSESQSAEKLLDLRVALDKLAPEDSELLMRYYGHDETAEELAPRFKLTPSGIRVRVHKLRKTMRRLLYPHSRADIAKMPIASAAISQWRHEKGLCQ